MREIMEALLLADADPEEIEDVFGFPQEATAYFAELFFDRAAFTSKFELISYLEEYPAGFGKELKLRTYTLGPEFIFFKYGNAIPTTAKQRNLIKNMFLGCAYRAMEANFNPLASEMTKHSLEWSKQMLKAYEALEKTVDSDASSAYDLQKIITRRELPSHTTSITEDEIV